MYFFPEFISLYGSLDLIETWDDGLYDPTSSLYIDTSQNFTSEVSQVKPVLNGLSQKDPKLVFKTNYRLMQVKRIAFCNTFDLHHVTICH